VKTKVSQVTGPAEKIVEAVRPLGKKFTLGKWTYRVPSETIPAEKIRETFTTDIVVLGAGTSGKAAALSASLAGARVIQLDRHTTFRWGGGHIAAIDSRVQKKLGIKVDKDDVCLQLMKYAGNYPDQRKIRLWAELSGETLDWVMDMTDKEGIQTKMYQWPRPAGFDLKTEYYPEYPVCHWQTDGTSTKLNHSLALNVLEKYALKNGIEIRYQTRAIQLIRQENGRVTGVIALDKGGNFVQFNARKAVILCTGEYGNNPWMMEKYCAPAAEIALKSNIYMMQNDDLIAAAEPLNTGDGHQMAMRIGAVMEPGPHAPMAHMSWAGPMGNNPFLRVNLEGERYENEDVPAQSIANSVSRQPSKKAWQIFDSKWQEEMPRMGVGVGRYSEMNEKLLENMRKATVFQADTIEELARKINVPVKTFKATIDRYNKMAEMGKDLDFGKRPDRLTTISKPPFHAGLSRQDFLIVMGGLNTNIRLQPLDADRKVIPGLYCAGNTVGNRFAVDYPTMCPGLSHGMAYVTGRLAGAYAAAEKA
jgi:fumarate reductase flavoprotein subunit